ncbi:acetyltransferase [Candidatus Gracilibacteria bacterium]|nr:acetyltransferase [Candidatus Gracilibacteria bacterium]
MTPKTLSPEPTVHPSAQIVDCVLGAWTEIGPHTWMAETSFGDYSYIADSGQIIYTTIGKFCSIASHVRINPGNHPMQRVTQHHMTYRRKMYGFAENDDEDFFAWRRAAHCSIGHDVWIGHGATVMPGVSIGSGAVVGAGAVVTKDVAPYTIAVGVPARPLRPRFRQPIAEALLRIAWWDWDRATLAARFADLNDVEAFVARYAGAGFMVAGAMTIHYDITIFNSFYSNLQ